MIEIIFEISILTILICIFFFYIYWWISIAPWIPTNYKDLKRINKLVNLKKWDIFFEIWSWDWRVSNYIATNNPQANIFWYEIFFPVYLFSIIKKLISNKNNLNFIFKDIFFENLNNVDVIYIFWLDYSLENKLKQKFLREMKPWSKIISYVFSFKSWDWEYYKDSPQSNWATIYVYTISKNNISNYK